MYIYICVCVLSRHVTSCHLMLRPGSLKGWLYDFRPHIRPLTTEGCAKDQLQWPTSKQGGSCAMMGPVTTLSCGGFILPTRTLPVLQM